MVDRKSRFMVGLFVAGGLLLGAAVIAWIGASRYFEQGSLYTTYFDESVQGLQVDSRVKYRGVDVGKVQRIGVAADRKLVEVMVKIDLPGGVGRDVVAQLRAAGITGIVFIELDRRNPDDPVLMPPQGLTNPYPVIPSQTSQTKQILTSMDRIMERLGEVDLRGISDQVKHTGRTIEGFFTDGRLPQVMKNLEAATASLDAGLKRLDGLLAGEEVDGLLREGRQGIGEARLMMAETREGIAEARRLVEQLAGEVKDLQTGEISQRAAIMITGLDQRTRRLGRNLELTNEDIRQTIETLRLLIEELRANPSRLIYSRPRPDDPLGEER